MEVVIHYHEIALKGGNRNFFVKRLTSNLRQIFKDMGKLTVKTLFGRITMQLDSEDEAELHRRMTAAFGVANYAIMHKVPQDFAQMQEAAWQALQSTKGETFAVRCSRTDKDFPKRSLEIEREIGSYILEQAEKTGRELKVRLKNPDITVRVEIVNRIVLISGKKYQGPGGLPTGTAGKVVGLLSSGFDSPVSCWNLMKRGAKVVFCHFHSYPFTNKASLDNCRELTDILTRFQLSSKVYLVGFAPVQEELLSLTPADLRMILYRRAMVRIASLIARKERAEALVTGESLGQVASQTLTNMAVIDQAASLPMLRPLVGADKEEIMSKARDIGTYELSSRPYEDCCSLMLSQHPETKARLSDVRRIEEALELEELERNSIKEAEIILLEWQGKEGVKRTVLQEPTYKEGVAPLSCCTLNPEK